MNRKGLLTAAVSQVKTWKAAGDSARLDVTQQWVVALVEEFEARGLSLSADATDTPGDPQSNRSATTVLLDISSFGPSTVKPRTEVPE